MAHEVEHWCSDCKTMKPRSAFSGRDKRDNYCKACRNRRAKQFYAERRDLILQQNRESQWRSKYGLDPEEYVTLLVSQGGGCAACGDSPSGRNKFLSVDHDHATGEIRGLLCHRCNTALGMLGDDLAGVLRLVAYLEGSSNA